MNVKWIQLMYLKKQIFRSFPTPSELSEDSSALHYFCVFVFLELGLMLESGESQALHLVGVLVFGLHRGWTLIYCRNEVLFWMKPFQILRQSTLVCKCKCACHHCTLSRVEESFKMLLTTSLCFPDGFLKRCERFLWRWRIGSDRSAGRGKLVCMG